MWRWNSNPNSILERFYQFSFVWLVSINQSDLTYLVYIYLCVWLFVFFLVNCHSICRLCIRNLYEKKNNIFLLKTSKQMFKEIFICTKVKLFSSLKSNQCLFHVFVFLHFIFGHIPSMRKKNLVTFLKRARSNLCLLWLCHLHRC